MSIEDTKCSKRIFDVRKQLRLSQSAIATALNIPLRSYQNYERGEREAPITLIRSLYEKFNICPLWIITGIGNMHIMTEKHIQWLRENAETIKAYNEFVAIHGTYNDAIKDTVKKV